MATQPRYLTLDERWALKNKRLREEQKRKLNRKEMREGLRTAVDKVLKGVSVGATAGLHVSQLAKPIWQLGTQLINDLASSYLFPQQPWQTSFLDAFIGREGPKPTCDEKKEQTQSKMGNFMKGLNAGGHAPGNASYLTNQGNVEDDTRLNDFKPIHDFSPSMLQDGLGEKGGRERCYAGNTVNRPGMGEFGRDRCAQLLDKAPNQDMSNATQIMLDNIEAKVRKANARNRVVF